MKLTIPYSHGVTVGQVVKDLKPRIGAHHTMAFAASLAYRSIFAVIPSLALVVLLLGIFHAEGLVERFLDASAAALPLDASQLIRTQLEGIVKNNHSGFGIAAIFSTALAVWSVSGAMRSLMEALNVMHDAEETRPFLAKYGVSIGLGIASILLLVTALVAIVVGGGAFESITAVLGLGSGSGGLVWAIIRWPLALLMVLIAFAMLYAIAPDVDQKFRFVTIGSVTATVLWMLFSLAFSLYANNFSSYSATWGALAGAIVFMLYVYYSAVMLLIGAQVDAIVEERSPVGEKRKTDAKGEQAERERADAGSGSAASYPEANAGRRIGARRPR
jgi:membrane protein